MPLMSYSHSLLLALLLSTCTLTTILFVLYSFNKNVPGLKDWVFAFLMGSINILIFYIQPPISELLRVFINHAILMCVGFLTLRACYLHVGAIFHHTKFVLVAIILVLITNAYLTIIEPNQPLRFFLTSLVSGVLFFIGGMKLIKDGFINSPIQFLFGVSLLIHSVFNSLRAALFLSPASESLRLVNLTPTDVIFYEQLVISILFALGIVMILNESTAKQLRHYAEFDNLTDLFNRRVFLDLLKKNKSLSLRTKTPSSLLMIDIDYFKSINDKYGHQIGDRVLMDFANRAKKNLREEDIISRMGGEEFAILLPNTNKQSALQSAERMRKLFETNCLKIGLNEITYTISIGVITFDDEMTIDNALNYSDIAMYQAKRNGRNQVLYYNT